MRLPPVIERVKSERIIERSEPIRVSVRHAPDGTVSTGSCTPGRRESDGDREEREKFRATPDGKEAEGGGEEARLRGAAYRHRSILISTSKRLEREPPRARLR